MVRSFKFHPNLHFVTGQKKVIETTFAASTFRRIQVIFQKLIHFKFLYIVWLTNTISVYLLRTAYGPRDLWTVLETNWNFFFWLTGELPPTLSQLVNSLRNRFHDQIQLGRHPVLDFRNQVSINLSDKMYISI